MPALHRIEQSTNHCAMKAAIVISSLIFTVGLVAKFFHLPFNAIVMIIGLFSLLIILIHAAIRKKSSRLNLGIGFGAVLSLIALLFALKFWPMADILMIAAGILTTSVIVVAARQKQLKKTLPMIICALLATTFLLMPNATRYYLVSIKWNHEIESDYFSWDKYSWFLFQDGERAEALEASNKALQIAQNSNDSFWIEHISSHNTNIKMGSWEQYW